MRGFRCAQDDDNRDPVGSTQEPVGGQQPVRRIEVRIETLVNRPDAPPDTCQVVQSLTGGPAALWSSLGEAERSGNSGFAASSAALQCATGVAPTVSGDGSIPLYRHDLSVTVGWDPGAMDPGPGEGGRLSLTVRSHRLRGFSTEGNPLYDDLGTAQRTFRLEEGEEFFVPLLTDGAEGSMALGVDEVMLRIQAGWAGRPEATEYASLAVRGAAPGSEILLDGGVAGRVGEEGTSLITGVRTGQRELRIRGTSDQVARRIVSIVKGKTAVVSPEPMDTRTVPQPFLTPDEKNSEGFMEYRRERDGAIMVQISEGEFLMGNLETEGAPLPHTVYVSSFLMDRLPVTVERFRRFAAATGRPLPPDPYWGAHDNYPVAFVRWDESRAYCEWAGGRLPTEAEREKATRGTDGRLWPWGSEPPNPARGVFRRNWGYEGNAAVGVRPAGASPYGLLDTGGNMWECCEDWFDRAYFKSSPRNDPTGPKTGRARVLKGGSWDSRPTVLSASSRNFGYVGYREAAFGFRCAAGSCRLAIG